MTTLAGTTGAFTGGTAGAAIGAFFGPIGIAVGGLLGAIVGGVSAGFVANALSDLLTNKIFGLSKDVRCTQKRFDCPDTLQEALAKAYEDLGLTRTASDDEVKVKIRELQLKMHPDKGGTTEQYIEFSANMALVLNDRKRAHI